ncbi:hypothetical protein MMC20_005576 [Loxospora ochrophaea]|nr:hypothetical protein [Loxospora ochrophaea]
MDMSSGSDLSNMTITKMPMSMMDMVFFTSVSTPLFSMSWAPRSEDAYAGTCIFLIILAAFFRLLVVGKHVLEHHWRDQELNRRYIAVRGRKLTAAEEAKSEDSDDATAKGVDVIARSHVRTITPWRFSVDLPRALYVMVMVGVGYLLMIAIMTMNVGYFMSILGGTFLGELATGRYTQLVEH